MVTGTFGSAGFLHAVLGDLSDQASQSELQSLENLLQAGRRSDIHLLKQLLHSLPPGILHANEDAKVDELQANATAAQMQNTHVSPQQPEAFTRQLQHVSREIHPILEWHDHIMKQIHDSAERTPINPQLRERVEDQINIFVTSLLSPFIVPIIEQVKRELNRESSEYIQKGKVHSPAVFQDDYATDPTHSSLGKDHFSNVSLQLRFFYIFLHLLFSFYRVIYLKLTTP